MTKRTKVFPSCPECGGDVRPTAKAGRLREYRRGIRLPIPDDFEIPTCVKCGEEMMSLDTSSKLDAALHKVFLADQAIFLRAVIQLLRARHGVTQGQIEDACGVTRSYLSHLLSGKRETSKTLMRLLETFALSPAAFDHARLDVPFDRYVVGLFLLPPDAAQGQRYRSDKQSDKPQPSYRASNWN